jgi:hypothetical protein
MMTRHNPNGCAGDPSGKHSDNRRVKEMSLKDINPLFAK